MPPGTKISVGKTAKGNRAKCIQSEKKSAEKRGKKLQSCHFCIRKLPIVTKNGNKICIPEKWDFFCATRQIVPKKQRQNPGKPTSDPRKTGDFLKSKRINIQKNAEILFFGGISIFLRRIFCGNACVPAAILRRNWSKPAPLPPFVAGDRSFSAMATSCPAAFCEEELRQRGCLRRRCRLLPGRHPPTGLDSVTRPTGACSLTPSAFCRCRSPSGTPPPKPDRIA